MVDTNIAKSATQSYLAGQRVSVLQEERERLKAREEAVKAKDKRIKAHRAKVGQSGYLGSKSYGQFASEFPQEAAQTATALGPQQEQQMQQLGNSWRTVRALPVEQRAEKAQGLIAGAVTMGVTDEDTADTLSNLMQQDPEQASAVIDQVFGIKAEGRKETERDRKIQELRDRGFTRQEAQDLADNRVRIDRDPLSGKTFLVNVATGERVAAEGGEKAPAAPVAPASAPGKTVFEMIGEGVGFGAVVSEGISRTVGQVAPSLADPETTIARTKIRGLREKLLQALAISGRPPVVEQTRLLQNIPSTGVFESEPHATAQLTELHGQLSRQLMDDLAYGNDTDNPKELRRKALEQAHHIQNMLRELGMPPSEESEGGVPQGAIDHLKANPDLAEQFDAKYGEGSSGRILGG